MERISLNDLVTTCVILLTASVSGVLSATTQQPSKNQLATLDQTALKAFLVPFRETVLHKVAVAWNHTISDSATLQVQLQQCSDHIKANVENCKTCAEAACQQEKQAISHSPTFKDYLGLAVSLANPVQYLKEPLNEIGDSFGNLVDLMGSGSEQFIDSMSALGNHVGGAFQDAFHGIESGANVVKDSMVMAGGTAIDGISGIGNQIGNGLSSAGHAIVDAGKTVLNGITGLFGRKRETVSAELQRCMQPCRVCDPLLLPQQRDMISSVCGADVVKFNETVRHNVARIKGIFAAVSDIQHSVIINVEYDPSSASGLTYTRMYVTANILGQYVRYRSTVAYDMMNVGSTAANVAQEFWLLWAQ